MTFTSHRMRLRTEFADTFDREQAHRTAPPRKNPFEGRMVLVVDDEPTHRLIAREVLEEHGYRIEEAADGPEAIVKAHIHEPAIIILDVVLPTLDGFTVCDELRRQAKTRGVPIILVTGLNDDASIERGFDVGAIDFLVKPVYWPTLAYRVRFCLRNAEAACCGQD